MNATLVALRALLVTARRALDGAVGLLDDAMALTGRARRRRWIGLRRWQVLERDGWRCSYCGKDLRSLPSGDAHVDHVVPRSRGGDDTLDNLVAACARCNLSKGPRTPSEWLS